MRNLGNTCYQAAVLQCLFEVPQLREAVTAAAVATAAVASYGGPTAPAITAAELVDVLRKRGLAKSCEALGIHK